MRVRNLCRKILVSGLIASLSLANFSGFSFYKEKKAEASSDTTTVSELPAKYDNRKYDVGNRKQYGGNCGYYSVIENAEIQYKRDTGKEKRFSPLCLAYAGIDTSALCDPLDNYQDKWNYNKSPRYACNDVEDSSSTMSTLASWRGLREWDENLDEEKVINGEITTLDSSYCTQNNQTMHMQNAYFLNCWAKRGSKEMEQVKHLIMKYGSVQCDYRAVGSLNYANDGILCMYQQDKGPLTHSEAVIGWDDNFDKNQFVYDPETSVYRPEHDGAWLVKSWDNNNYTWMSYDSVTLGFDSVYDFESADNYDYNYQYDVGTGLRLVSSADLSSNIVYDNTKGSMMANIFTAKNNIDVKAVSFYTDATYINCKVEVYTGCGENPTDGKLADTIDTYTEEFGGYHTVKLNKDILVPKGEKYSVVITQIPSEDSKDQMYNTGGYAKPVTCGNYTEPNTSFAKGISQEEWCTQVQDGSIAVKAFADEHTGFTVSYENSDWFTTADGYDETCVEAKGSFAFKATSKFNTDKYAVRVDGKTVAPDANGLYHIDDIMSNKVVTTVSKDKYYVNVHFADGNKYIRADKKMVSFTKQMAFETDYQFDVSCESIYEVKDKNNFFQYVTVTSDSDNVTVKKSDSSYTVSVNGIGANNDIDIYINLSDTVEPKDVFSLYHGYYQSGSQFGNSRYITTNEDSITLFPTKPVTKLEGTADYITNNANGTITIDTSSFTEEEKVEVHFRYYDENGVTGSSDDYYCITMDRTAPDTTIVVKDDNREDIVQKDDTYEYYHTPYINYTSVFTSDNENDTTYYFIDCPDENADDYLTDEELKDIEFKEGRPNKENMKEEGRYVIYAYAVDALGNKSGIVHSAPIMVDRTNPVMDKAEAVKDGDKVKLSFHANDNSADVTYTIEKIIYKAGLEQKNYTMAEKITSETYVDKNPLEGIEAEINKSLEVDYNIYAEDKAGNKSAYRCIQVDYSEYDYEDPVMDKAEAVKDGDKVKLSFHANDNSADVTYTIEKIIYKAGLEQKNYTMAEGITSETYVDKNPLEGIEAKINESLEVNYNIYAEDKAGNKSVYRCAQVDYSEYDCEAPVFDKFTAKIKDGKVVLNYHADDKSKVTYKIEKIYYLNTGGTYTKTLATDITDETFTDDNPNTIENYEYILYVVSAEDEFGYEENISELFYLKDILATPTPIPTVEPIVTPTTKPTAVPTTEPTVKPTTMPTVAPSANPTTVPTNTQEPTVKPTTESTNTQEPSGTSIPAPVRVPTSAPTLMPTTEPTEMPSVIPIVAPTNTSSAKDITTLKKSEKITAKGITYVITKLSGKKGTVKVVSAKKTLKNVKIPDTVSTKGYTFNVTEISKTAFAGCKCKKVTLGKNVTVIGKDAFKNCKSLKEIKITSPKIKAHKTSFKTSCKKTIILITKKNYKKVSKMIPKSKGIVIKKG